MREGGRLRGVGRGAAGVAHDGRELIEERAEAVRRGAVAQGVGVRLVLGVFRARGRGDRIACGFRRLIFVGEEQGAPRFAHVPLDVVGEHAQQDVRAHPIGQMVVDGAHLQIDRLERAEGAFHIAQGLVAAHDISGRDDLGTKRRAQHVNAVERGFLLDLLLVDAIAEARLLDRSARSAWRPCIC